MTDLERRAAIQRIAAALHGFDDDLLRELDAVVAAPVARGAGSRDATVDAAYDGMPGGLSRRQAIGGGAALAVLSLAAARWLAARRDAGLALGEDTALGAVGDAGSGERGAGLGDRNELAALYRTLMSENLDAESLAALAALAPSLGDVIETAKSLAVGLDTVAGGLAAAEGALPPLRDGVARAEAVIGQLAEAMGQAVDGIPSLPSVSGSVANNAQAAADAIGGWLAEATGALPFGVGDTLRARLEAVRRVIILVPETVHAVDGALLGPLRAQWLPADGAPGAGIETGLFGPLHDGVLNHGLALVAAAAELAAWRAGTEAELAAMIARRADTLRRIEALQGGDGTGPGEASEGG